MAQPLEVLAPPSAKPAPRNRPERAQGNIIHLKTLANTAKATRISPNVLKGSLWAAEFVIIAISGLLLATLYVPSTDVWRNGHYIIALSSAALMTVMIFEACRLYSRNAISSPLRSMPRIALAWTASLALLVAAAFFLKIGPAYSRVWLVMWFTAGIFLLLASRFVLAAFTRQWARQGRLNRRAIIFGGGQPCDQFIAAIENDQDSDIQICGIFDERGDERAPDAHPDYPKLGNLDDLVDFVRNARVDVVVLTLPLSAEDRLTQAMRKIGILPVDVRLSASSTKLRFRPRTYSHIGNVPVIDLADKPITDWNLIAKWAFDKLVAALAIVALSPIMIATAIAIRLESRGPIFFRQKRYGFNNELIEVYKFRSMYTDRCDANASRLVTKDDPRVTRVGRIIRKTSIDELPQLINVLRGELSLVGPRPHALHAKAADTLYDDAVEGYSARHRVKPGITGWAQINGWRGETDTEEKIRKRVEYDLYYIENWSLMLDLYILARTPFALFKTDNAY